VRLSVVTLFAVALLAGALAFIGGASAVGSPCSFGLSTVGGFNGSIAADTKKVTRYTAVACNITKLTGYVSGGNVGGGPQHVRAVVYADSGGLPGARLAVSNEVNVAQNQAAGWVDFSLPAPVAISAGPIWMGYVGSSPNIGIPKYDGTGVAVRYNTDSYADGVSDPFGSSTAGVVATYSLYASGTTGGSGLGFFKYGTALGARFTFAETSDEQTASIAIIHDLHSKIQRPDCGIFDQQRIKDGVQKLMNEGFQIDCVMGSTPNYPWSGVTAAQFGAACASAASFLSGSDHPMIEALNEPDIHGWTPLAYLPYLEACHDQAKLANPNVTVLLAGLWKGTTACGTRCWVSTLYSLGAKPYFDLMNFHGYGDPNDHYAEPTCDLGNPWDYMYGATSGPCAGITDSVRAIMNAQGDSAKPIVCTECGDNSDATTLAYQNNAVIGALNAVDGVGTGDHKTLFTLIYTTENIESPGFGMLNSDGTHKPSYDSYKSIAIAGGQ
jgi:hypothetical protein